MRRPRHCQFAFRYSWRVPLPEFWQEEPAESQKLYRKQAVRWGLLFVCLCAGVFFAFWWSGSAVHFGASRVTETTAPTFRLLGTAIDAKTGAAIPWVSVQDDPAGHPPLFQTLGDVNGSFELITIPEPHYVIFSALGYRSRRVKIGKIWYLWMPSGDERMQVRLEPEPRND